jgi:hypothetical protein
MSFAIFVPLFVSVALLASWKLSEKVTSVTCAKHERNTMTNDEMFDPQPAKATVTIEGGLERWHELYQWLEHRFANVDFDYRQNKVVFHCYPFAVND